MLEEGKILENSRASEGNRLSLRQVEYTDASSVYTARSGSRAKNQREA